MFKPTEENIVDAADVMFEIASVLVETFWPTPDTDKWLDDNASMFGNPIDSDFKTIQCIKEVRVQFAIGLKEAKDVVEDWRKSKGYVPYSYR
jgi:hypothetical protein